VSGETDLERILATLTVRRLDDPVTVVSVPGPVAMAEGVLAVVVEPEGTTAIVTTEAATARGWTVGFVGAWLTVEVHTSLEAVGLTAALSTALAGRGIACNVVAGFHHDHLVVPIDRAAEALEVLRGLSGKGA
jgi:hypothetical protein